MAPFWSTALQYITSRESYSQDGKEHEDEVHPLPFLASPVDPTAYAWLKRRNLADPLVPGKVQRSNTVAQFEKEQGADSSLAKRIFRKQHEASSIELFFDLFFVANLAVFTDQHAHVDGLTVANYIGFFTILWSTWFHISIYDVRFYVDCILYRGFKIFTFLVMISFVTLNPLYNTIAGDTQTASFKGMALILMTLRWILAIQYLIVLYFVHGFHKTLIPLLLTISVYIASGFGFLGTYLADRKNTLTSTEGSNHVIRWYIIIVVEALLIMVISSVWRVLSFRHTHLVERVGLLTLIVMGEGIIGMIKAAAYDLLGRNASIWTEAGLLTSAVVMIYFIYILYFNSVNYDHSEQRFGSVRQQIWVVLHYFLHIAILLTVEGQSALIIWNNVRRGIRWFGNRFPDVNDPAGNLTSTAELVTKVNNCINVTATRFYYYKLSDYYNPSSDLAALGNVTAPFGSSEWNSTVSPIIDRVRWNIQYFIFVNFQAEGPKAIDKTSDPAVKVALYNSGFKVVFEYFYIAAGGLLLMLAVMLWFGRTNKRTDEWGSMIIRTVVGLGLPFVSLVAFLEDPGTMRSWRFRHVEWIIPIVTIAYLGVLCLDNLFKVVLSIARRHRKKHRRNSSASTAADEETAYIADPEEQHRRMKYAQLQNHDQTQHHGHDAAHSRDSSQDSDKTLSDQHPSFIAGRGGRKRTYLNLSQHDDND